MKTPLFKRNLLLFLMLILALLITGCAQREVIDQCLSGHTYGFFGGLWHGFIAPFDLLPCCSTIRSQCLPKTTMADYMPSDSLSAVADGVSSEAGEYGGFTVPELIFNLKNSTRQRLWNDLSPNPSHLYTICVVRTREGGTGGGEGNLETKQVTGGVSGKACIIVGNV